MSAVIEREAAYGEGSRYGRSGMPVRRKRLLQEEAMTQVAHAVPSSPYEGMTPADLDLDDLTALSSEAFDDAARTARLQGHPVTTVDDDGHVTRRFLDGRVEDVEPLIGRDARPRLG